MATLSYLRNKGSKNFLFKAIMMYTESLSSKRSKVRKIVLKHHIIDTVFICIGVLMASIGLKGFLFPSGFLDGGAMGVALLLRLLTPIDLSYLIILINIPFIFLGARHFSWVFAIKSAIAIVTLSALVHLLDFPTVTHDKLLIAVFGGFFIGSGIGFTRRGGAVIDGTVILAVPVRRRSWRTVGDFRAIFNVILFTFAVLLVSIETAMYSMLIYLSASKTVDFIINGIEEYIGVMIVSDSTAEIQGKIINDLGRGVTVFKSEGGFGKKGHIEMDRNVLFCVITRLEVTKLLHEIDKIDPTAFVIQYPIKDTKGGMIKKRPMH